MHRYSILLLLLTFSVACLKSSSDAEGTNFLPIEVDAVCKIDEGKHYVFVSMAVKTNTDGTAQIPLKKAGWNPIRRYYGEAVFFLPTNSICGSLQLFDENGKSLKARKLKEVAPAAFPDKMELQSLVKHYSSGVTPETPLTQALDALPGDRKSLRQFCLEEYFLMSDMHEYRLTISPKIYLRSATNSSFIERVDLSPINLKITN